MGNLYAYRPTGFTLCIVRFNGIKFGRTKVITNQDIDETDADIVHDRADNGSG